MVGASHSTKELRYGWQEEYCEESASERDAAHVLGELHLEIRERRRFHQTMCNLADPPKPWPHQGGEDVLAVGRRRTEGRARCPRHEQSQLHNSFGRTVSSRRFGAIGTALRFVQRWCCDFGRGLSQERHQLARGQAVEA